MVYLALMFLLFPGLYLFVADRPSHILTAGKPLIISHNGASGDYPGCTDLAYQKAVDDGADVIDCPVQVTKDGIPICMSSIDLMNDTTVARSQFISQTATIKDIQIAQGVFTFNLTWDDIVNNLQRKLN
jgi:glycerophosphoryl diester phosphodiesterase